MEVSILATSDEDRLATDTAEGPGRAVYSTGDEPASFVERLVTSRTVGLHGASFLRAKRRAAQVAGCLPKSARRADLVTPLGDLVAGHAALRHEVTVENCQVARQ